ncbi:YozQ family protein [Alicyclobacillus tolerans]|uniref:YozQ family protein n=1 Tax=Alicyclobacillus tolerans TaxID=90970 RepID=UPI001F31EEA8|nr:YozQ family protein [Alicyclobacillus tolerans]MCF8563474.1 YozQ family protein [Alicyclobacillus tolerans]
MLRCEDKTNPEVRFVQPEDTSFRNSGDANPDADAAVTQEQLYDVYMEGTIDQLDGVRTMQFPGIEQAAASNSRLTITSSSEGDAKQ